MNKNLVLLSLSAVIMGCASPRSVVTTSVSILEINSAGGATTTRDGHEEPFIGLSGARAALESQLLKNGVSIQGDPDVGRVLGSSGPVEGAGGLSKNVMLVLKIGPSPASKKPTYGVIVDIQHNVGLLTAFSLGLLPYTIDVNARVIDLRTHEVRASVESRTLGNIYSSSGVNKAMRNLGDKIALELRRLEVRDVLTANGRDEEVSL